MPMHDWTRVEPAIFYALHHDWISEIKRALTHGLPRDYYAMIEPVVGFGAGKNSVVVRHVSGDRIVAMIEIISPGNKNNNNAFNAFIAKACELLEHRIHLLLIDPFPPGRRDPNGIHAAIWAMVDDEPFRVPPERPLTLVAYECGLTTEAYIETIAVGEAVPGDATLPRTRGAHPGAVGDDLHRGLGDGSGPLAARRRSVARGKVTACGTIRWSRHPCRYAIIFDRRSITSSRGKNFTACGQRPSSSTCERFF